MVRLLSVSVAMLCIAVGGGVSAQAGKVGAASNVAAVVSRSAVREMANSDEFAMRVAEAVAARWGVDPAVVRVEPASSSTKWPAGDAAFTLHGSGADGMWLVDARLDNASTRLIVRAGIEAVEQAAARDLERNESIDADDVVLRTVVRWGPPSDDVPVVEPGWIVRRRITRGDALRPPAVAPPLAVRPGQDVRLVFIGNGITITLSGRAAGQASIGERVAVRAGTGKRVEGIVTAEGVVTIASPGREQR